MRRLKVTLLVVAAMLAMLTMTAAPALAVNTDDCRNRPGPFIRCDGERFVNVDRADDLFGDNNNRLNEGFDCFDCGFNRLNDGFGFVDNSCPFWNDFSGIINWTDCLD